MLGYLQVRWQSKMEHNGIGAAAGLKSGSEYGKLAPGGFAPCYPTFRMSVGMNLKPNLTNNKMKFEIEINEHLLGFLWSLEVSELDNDYIEEDISESNHLDECISFGLIYIEMDAADLPEYHLTRLGKTVYNRRPARIRASARNDG